MITDKFLKQQNDGRLQDRTLKLNLDLLKVYDLLSNESFAYALKMLPKIEIKAVFHDLGNKCSFSTDERKTIKYVTKNFKD